MPYGCAAHMTVLKTSCLSAGGLFCRTLKQSFYGIFSKIRFVSVLGSLDRPRSFRMRLVFEY